MKLLTRAQRYPHDLTTNGGSHSAGLHRQRDSTRRQKHSSAIVCPRSHSYPKAASASPRLRQALRNTSSSEMYQAPSLGMSKSPSIATPRQAPPHCCSHCEDPDGENDADWPLKLKLPLAQPRNFKRVITILAQLPAPSFITAINNCHHIVHIVLRFYDTKANRLAYFLLPPLSMSWPARCSKVGVRPRKSSTVHFERNRKCLFW